MTASISLRLASEARSVGIVRDTCAATLGRLDIDRECIELVKLAVTEACTNAVEHGCPGDSAFDVHLVVVGEWCYIDVADRGRGFDSTSVTFEPPPAPSIRGRGLSIMRRIVDHVAVWSSLGAGTRVLLAKQLRFTPPA